nr:integrase, catalytic region, zinc finger, CCHC-type, peptidase aspartic, catalytic [Tanacetum cinerariifolium]
MSEQFMNYLEEQKDGKSMINSIRNGEHPFPVVTQVNDIAKDLRDALERQMRGSEYGEQDRKAEILYEYETFKATEGEQLLDTYLRYLQVINDLKKCGYNKDNCELNDKFLNNLQPKWKQYEETITELSYYTSDFESESGYETSEYYDNSTNYGLFVDNDDDQEFFHDEKNNEFNEQIKVLNEKNDDLLAQTDVLQEQLKVKHVVIDTYTECKAQYAKLEEERYQYMIRYSALCDNDKQHRKRIDEQEILLYKMDRQLVEMNNNVLRLQEKTLEKQMKILELKECVRNKDLENEKCLERLYDCENNLHKIRQIRQTIHMIMPSKDKMYNGRKGIDLDTLSTVRRPKHSSVIWKKKKGSSNTSNVELSYHMTRNRALLTNFVKKFFGTVRFGNNDFAVIAGYGDVVIGSMAIKKVYYVEGLGHNLFSVRQFCDKGLEVAFRKSTCFVRNEDGVALLTGYRSSNLYTIALNKIASNYLACLLAKASSSQPWLWHQRFSHLNFATINNLMKNNLVRGLPKMKFEKDHLCSACEQGKIRRKHHKPKTAFASNKLLYLLHMDLCGPMRVESINEK